MSIKEMELGEKTVNEQIVEEIDKMSLLSSE